GTTAISVALCAPSGLEIRNFFTFGIDIPSYHSRWHNSANKMPPRKPAKLDQDALWNYPLKSMAARAQSIGEIREKLRRKTQRRADVDQVMVRLKEYGVVNDKQFAEMYASRRRENEGFGKMRVIRDLRQKRVAPAVAEQAAERVFQGSDEVELIEAFLARKYRRTPLVEVLAEEKGLASVYRKLRMAGFSSGNSLKVLKKHTTKTEVFDGL